MLAKLKASIKCIRHIYATYRSYEAHVQNLSKEVRLLQDAVKEHTTVHADVHVSQRERNYIIVAGTFRNTEYVKTFTVDNYEFKSLITYLNELTKTAKVGYIDAHPEMRICVKRELNKP